MTSLKNRAASLSSQHHPPSFPVKVTDQEWSEGAVPEVSICCITYNHELFIRQCIQGFLAQETTFPIEILIHDDASIDNTATIIREFENEFPRLIKPIYQTKNQYSEGISPNRQFNYPRARGRYIALCEGDDYWTDPTKLQRHKEFLDANSQYVMVADNAIWEDVADSRRRLFSDLPERDIGIRELLDKRQFATASVLYRNMKDELINSNTHPWFHLTHFGKIRYFPRVSSVYHRHVGGVTAGDKVEWAKKMIDWNNRMRKNHPEAGEETFRTRDLRVISGALATLLRQKRYEELFFAADDLARCTVDPAAYRNEIYTYLGKRFREQDIRLNDLENHALLRFLRLPRRAIRAIVRRGKR